MFYGTYIGNDRMLIKTKWGMRLIASCSDMSLMPTLMVDGQIESGLTNWLINNQEKMKGKLFVDVGANIGYFTVLFSCITGPQGKIMAFEANPKVFDLLAENVYLSQLQYNTDILPYAVSNSHLTDVTFNVSKRYQGNSSINAHTEAYKEQFATDEFEEVTAKTVALDFLTYPADIFLLKVDVEGAEYKVLSGAKNLLKSGHVKNVVFELNKNMLGDEEQPLKELLIELNKEGAMFYVFTPQGETVFAKLDDIFEQGYVDNILMKLN